MNPVYWRDVDDRAKGTIQTIRALLDYHGIGYWMSSTDKAGVYLYTRMFAVEIERDGTVCYGPPRDERPKDLESHPLHEPFVCVFSDLPGNPR